MIRLYIKPWCPWCMMAESWLEQRGIPYEKLDVTTDRAAYEEMVHLSGQYRAPTAAVNGRVLADFGPDQLGPFLRTLGVHWDEDA